nr:SDR family oxidoreductase [Dictyobacter vulcani]
MLMRTICLNWPPTILPSIISARVPLIPPLTQTSKPNPKKYQALLDEIPLHRMGQPEEIGKLALYLASDAAAYVTG